MRAAFLRRLGRWLLEGGALFAILAGLYQVYADWRDDRSGLSVEACRRADEAILDESMNPALTPRQRELFLRRKLNLSARCDKLGT